LILARPRHGLPLLCDGLHSFRRAQPLAAPAPASRKLCSVGSRVMQIRGQRFSGRRSLEGFTIIELMVTLVVGAVLLGIAVPSFRGYVQDGRLSNESYTLVYSLNLARS